MSNFLRPMRTFFTMLGAALPTPNPDKHGQFQVKQAAATEDELYNVLRDSSGALQNRRIVTTTLGSTLYSGPITVKEANSAVDATVTTFDFDGDNFNVSESPEDEVNITLNLGTGASNPAAGNHNHDAAYVDVAGDTMTGALNVDVTASATLRVRNTGGSTTYMIMDAGASPGLQLYNGSDFYIFSDAGTTFLLELDSSSAYLRLHNGMDFALYSDGGSTQKLLIDGATGDIDTEGQITLGAGGAEIIEGSATPEGAANAPVSSLYHRTGATVPNTELYTKLAGTGTDTSGWVPINTGITFALGPFLFPDLPGTATTQLQNFYFNTTTALSLDTDDPTMQAPGRVVGIIAQSDVARTAGTATFTVRVSGVSTAFNSGAVALDATNTLSDSSFVNHASGVAFVAGDELGIACVTSGWTPTTANVKAWLIISLDPFV